MPPLSVIQPSFSGGEYSPHLYSRVDIAKYSTGLRTCRNFIIHPHGGASNRPGTKYVADAKYADRKCRVVRFIFSTTEVYVLEFGDNYIRFFTDQQPVDAVVTQTYNAATQYYQNDYVTYNSAHYLAILDNLSENPASATTYWTEQNEYEIYSPYPEEDLDLLRFESSADVIYITHPDYQPRKLTRYGNANWELSLYSSDSGPFMPQNITDTTMSVTAVTGSVTLNSSVSYFDDLHVGSLFKLKHFIEGQALAVAFGSVTTSSSIKCCTTWRLITHGTWTAKFNVEMSTDGGLSWEVIRSFSGSDDFNANTSGTEDPSIYTEPFLIRLNCTDYTSGTLNADLTSDSFFQEGICRVLTYNSASAVDVEILQEFGLTDVTTEWSEGSWSDYRGWPAVSRFFQDRLVFSGTYSEPMTNWMTEIGNYESFVRHIPLLDSDGITSNLPSRQLNAINGLVAFKKLVAFTSASEWTIGAVSGTALTPTTCQQTVEGYRGSCGVDPAIVGNECIFVQANSKVVRNLQYQLAYDSFTGADLSILARHLFDRYTIKEIAYQQDPDSIVWMLRDDGVLLGMTYMQEQEVVAWTHHDTGGGPNDKGVIESICTIPGEGFDELWMVVQRGNYRFIERMSQRIVTATCNSGDRDIHVDNSYFVDCGVTIGETPIQITSFKFDDPIVVTAPSHGFSNGNLVKFNHISDPTAATLNGTSWYIDNVTTNTFELSAEA